LAKQRKLYVFDRQEDDIQEHQDDDDQMAWCLRTERANDADDSLHCDVTE
jgi:hypothetical protein